MPLTRRSLLLTSAAVAAASGPRVACLFRPAPAFDGYVAAFPGAVPPAGASNLAAILFTESRYDPKTFLPPAAMMDGAIAAASVAGAPLLIVTGQGLYRDRRVLPDDMIRKVLALNNAGRRCLAKRIRLCYRNGDAEFIQNGLEMEHLVRRTNPELVSLCLDPVAATRPGPFNTADFLARYSGRIEAIHLPAASSSAADHKALAREIRTRRWDGWIIAEDPSQRAHIRKTFGV